jgi:hypothetical protein
MSVPFCWRFEVSSGLFTVSHLARLLLAALLKPVYDFDGVVIYRRRRRQLAERTEEKECCHTFSHVGEVKNSNDSNPPKFYRFFIKEILVLNNIGTKI